MAREMKSPDKLTGEEHEVRRLCDSHGLYLLVSGDRGNKRQWQIYARKSGKILVTYFPRNGRVLSHTTLTRDSIEPWWQLLPRLGEMLAAAPPTPEPTNLAGVVNLRLP